MFCPNCGIQVPDDAAFCPACGASFAQQAPAAPEPQAAPIYEPIQTPQAQAYEPQAYQPQAYQQTPAYDQNAYQQQTYQQAPAYAQTPAPAPAAAAAVPAYTCMKTPLKPFALPSSIGELFVGYNKTAVQYAESTGIKMKWYKAITAVLFYLSALGLLWSGLDTIFDFSDTGFSGYMYGSYPALQALDIVYGLVLIIMAFVVLYVRMHLAQFSTDGPHLYLLMLLVNGGASVIYTLLISLIVGYFSFSTIISPLIGVLAMFTLNRIYFDKRQHLFTM